MANEDFNTYTEVDTPGVLSIPSSSQIDYTGLQRNHESYIYDDKEVDHFAGDYEHLIDFNVASGAINALCAIWLLANTVDDYSAIVNSATEDCHVIQINVSSTNTNYVIRLRESVGSSLYTDLTLAQPMNSRRYLTIARDEAIGTYGTLYCYVYSDADRTTLVDTLSIALHEKEDFRYVYPIAAYNDGLTNTMTGDVRNLDLQEDVGVVILRRRMEDY
jgi:hypothetical protein